MPGRKRHLAKSLVELVIQQLVDRTRRFAHLRRGKVCETIEALAFRVFSNDDLAAAVAKMQRRCPAVY